MADPGNADEANAGVVDVGVERFFEAVALPESMRRVLVALSGGPDSVALLCATVPRARRHGIDVVACWVDHALRPASELLDEEAFVRSLCARLGVRLVVQPAERGQIEALATRAGGIEAAARNFRYEALERARAFADCDAILTGHNADDVLETMLMRFLTGSGSSGLRGIPERNGYVARPLLSATKADVLAYLAALGQPYRVDSTNESNDYTRNRVRHDLVPAVRAVFPSCGTALGTLAHKMRLDDDALSVQAEALRSDDVPDGGSNAGRPLSAARFDNAPVAVRVRALYLLACDQGFGRLPWRLTLAAATAPAVDGPLASGSGLQFLRIGGRIVARGLVGARPVPVLARDNGFAVRIDGFGVYRIGKAGSCAVYSSDHAPGLRLDSFEWPLWIRSRRPGDAIAAATGLKMVDTVLSEYRRHGGTPEDAVVMEDRSGIVAVFAGQSEPRPVYRRNDSLLATRAPGFLVFDLKGVVRTDAV